MKKPLLFSTLILIGTLKASAQSPITILTSDITGPGKAIYQANDTLPAASLSIGTPGPNKTWDMTMLNAAILDTSNYLSYAAAPNPDFPNSNLILEQLYANGSASVYEYQKNSATDLTRLGTVESFDPGSGPISITTFNTPAEKVMNFPTSYLSSFTQTLNMVTPPTQFLPPYVDSVKSQVVEKKTVLVDAWGSITTPLGTFDALRIKETVVQQGTQDFMYFGNWMSSPVSDSSTSFTWYAKYVGVPLVTISVDSFGEIIVPIRWLKVNPNPTAGINESTANFAASIYPNPAQNEITFEADAQKVNTIQVFDIAGRLMETVPVTNNKSELNTTDFKNGVYLYQFIGIDNNEVYHGKFSIVK